jgi:NAD-dependent DNA ligase
MKPAIIDIPGIGPAAAATLAEHRIRGIATLAKAPVEKIAAIPGFGEARATRVIAAAAELLAASNTSTPARTAAKTAEKTEVKAKSGGKDKKQKKDKQKKSKGKNKDKGKKKGKGKDKKKKNKGTK